MRSSSVGSITSDLTDVAGHEELEAEQDASTERRAERPVGLGPFSTQGTAREQHRRQRRAAEDRHRARQLEPDHRKSEEGAEPIRLNGDHTIPGVGYC